MKSSILTLAIALAFSFTAVPADAAPTLEDRCKAHVVKAERKYTACITGLVARGLRFGQQTVGQATMIEQCDSRRTKEFNKIESKFASIAAVDCGLDAQSLAVRAHAALVVAGLAEGHTNSDIAAIAAAAAQAACVEANGTWESGTCTAVSSYNCTIGAMCSAWAAEYPDELEQYTNNYINHTADTSGCAAEPWGNMSVCVSSRLWLILPIPNDGGLPLLACE